MIKVALVRGRYLNNFEGQNYIFNERMIQLTGISSIKSLNNKFPFPVIKLLSVADLQDITFVNKPLKFLMNRLTGDPQILFGLEKYAHQFDIFHTADSHYYYSYQLAKLRKKDVIKKLISTSWETIPFNNETVKRKKYIKKFTQKYVDLFICYTKKAKQCLLMEGISNNKIKVVKLGVDLKRFKSEKSKVKSQKHKSKVKIKGLTILFVGRMVEEKGIFDLKKIIKLIQKSKIKNQKHKLEVKIVTDSIDYQDMPKIYQEADIFVLPSKKTITWEEQYGMVLVEAMASGLPIVAYDTGAIKEVVGEAGILVREGDIVNFTKALEQLSGDDKLRLKLGKIGRKRAEKLFDAKKTVLKIQKIYENLSGNSY